MLTFSALQLLRKRNSLRPRGKVSSRTVALQQCKDMLRQLVLTGVRLHQAVEW